jgi:hypothetical protein
MRALHVLNAVALVLAMPACNAMLGVDEVSLERPDAGVAAPAPDAGIHCNVSSSFPRVASNSSTSDLDHSTTGAPSLVILLNTDTTPDVLGLLLIDGKPGRGVLNTPGSYALAASDSKLETCAICLRIYVDVDKDGNAAETYMALGQGSLVLTAADSTRFAGRMLGLKFRHVDNSGSATREVSDGCTVAVDDVEFDMTYPAADRGAVGLQSRVSLRSSSAEAR